LASGLGSGCHVSEFDENLRRDVQDFIAPVQVQHRLGSSRVLHIGGIRQTHQDAGIDEEGHQS